MILKKYGKSYHPVTPNFDSRAMTEVGFQKTGDEAIPVEEFDARYELLGERELVANAEGHVQDEVEQEMLRRLRAQLLEVEQQLGPDSVLVVENQPGSDYPKTREKVSTVTVGSQNQLQFQRTIEPPLRIGVYRSRKS